MKKRLLPFILLLSFSGICFSQNRFVDSTALAGGDGTSWATAYHDLQLALNDPSNPDSIFVAEGTYKPDEAGGNNIVSFSITQDVILLGGFPSGGGEREPVLNKTILSGDLNGDDVEGDFVTARTDNAKTVVFIESNISNATVIDGFIIKNGHSDGISNNPFGRGGGMYSWGSPVIRKCIFEQNFASFNGGGVYARESDAQGIKFELIMGFQ